MILPQRGFPFQHEEYAKNSGACAWSDAAQGEPKSHGGYILMWMNAAICWASRRSKVVAISSTEAEVIAGVAAAKDIKFMRAILTFMWEEITGTIPLFIDNEGMWFNTRNVGVSARTRYWELWQQFVRECYVNGILSPYLIERNDEVVPTS